MAKITRSGSAEWDGSTEEETLLKTIGMSGDASNVPTLSSMLSEQLQQKLEQIPSSENHEILDENSPKVSSFTTSDKKDVKPQGMPKIPVHTETYLNACYSVYDGLIGLFEQEDINSEYNKNIMRLIDNMEYVVNNSGGKVEKFSPLDHVSGLTSPDLLENAERVINTTIKCYRGTIKNPSISEDGKIIRITFEGTYNDTIYNAIGNVKSNEWLGNEAIDYIYLTDGSGGKMSVKCYENGKWIDQEKDGKRNYDIQWDLEECDISENQDVQDNVEVVEEKENDNNIEKDKEKINDVKDIGENISLEEKEEDLSDFPINIKGENNEAVEEDNNIK